MNFFTELINRFKYESPKFFKKVGSYALALGGIGAAILATKLDPSNTIKFSETVYNIAEHLVSVGAIAKIVAAWTVKEPDYSTLDKPVTGE